MNHCINCKNQFNLEEMFACDCCSENYCSVCAELSISEIKALQLKRKRIIKFFCESCNVHVNNYVLNQNITSNETSNSPIAKNNQNSLNSSTQETTADVSLMGNKLNNIENSVKRLINEINLLKNKSFSPENVTDSIKQNVKPASQSDKSTKPSNHDKTAQCSEQRKKKVLIIGDELATSAGNLFSEYLSRRKYKIECLSKPQAPLTKIFENLSEKIN